MMFRLKVLLERTVAKSELASSVYSRIILDAHIKSRSKKYFHIKLENEEKTLKLK